MNLIHKRAVSPEGMVIRIIGSKCCIIKEDIYQYVVDMLFPGNNWQRVLVSQLYYDYWLFFIDIDKYGRTIESGFKIPLLGRQAREKYGQEYRTNQETDHLSSSVEERR